MRDEIALSTDDLRAVAGFAAECAQQVLALFERDHPADPRPRLAVDAARAFAGGGERTKALRVTALAAHAAAREAVTPAARDAARAAGHAAAAAYLHPLARATQVKHVLGAAAHAARAAELAAGDDRTVGAEDLERARRWATPTVVDVLKRYPEAPRGGGRVAELLRELDTALRR
ncbi:putative immunity protein [Geodermatophilus sabuli]|uniref:Imm-5-like domain-containing protein n=1 Tax=Geodermatophilus sabuli TaxID=1564158 RepID=A0A285E6R1_9ACTN|nr:exonuclease SbcC [Geodermatophilus sabuli]MBB3082321.1 hypothetical protein [Geodermatophilus sabuli]SNX94809.1 hypothetical protein SAMN06893097_101606 [Geodermatophilus sabuli]